MRKKALQWDPMCSQFDKEPRPYTYLRVAFCVSLLAASCEGSKRYTSRQLRCAHEDFGQSLSGTTYIANYMCRLLFHLAIFTEDSSALSVGHVENLSVTTSAPNTTCDVGERAIFRDQTLDLPSDLASGTKPLIPEVVAVCGPIMSLS